jgi:hypothetical protein
VEAWWHWNTFRRVGEEYCGEPLTSEHLARMATPLTQTEAKRMVKVTTEQLGDRLQNVEMVPVQPN